MQEERERVNQADEPTIHEGELVIDLDKPAEEPTQDTADTPHAPADVIQLVEMPTRSKTTSKSTDEPSAEVEGPDKTPIDPDARLKRSGEEIDRARHRQQAFLKKRRKQKKLRVIYGRLRILIKLCFVVLLGFGLWKLAVAPFWLYQNPNFVVNELHLLGRGDIEPIIQAYAGEPIYQVDPKQIETILKEKYPIIERVDVRRALFPERLHLIITEKKPWGELYASASHAVPYAVVASDYQPVSLRTYKRASAFYPNEDLPKVVLPMAALNQSGVTPEFLKRVNELTYQLAQIPGINLKYVDASRPDQVQAYFDVVQVQVGRLDATTSERVGRLFGLIDEIYRMRGKIDAVDLRWLNQVTFHRGSYELPEPYRFKELKLEDIPETTESNNDQGAHESHDG